MIGSGYWEFEGKEEKLPKGLIYRKKGGLDFRYKINRDFSADKRWVYKNPTLENMRKLLIEYVQTSYSTANLEEREE